MKPSPPALEGGPLDRQGSPLLAFYTHLSKEFKTLYTETLSLVMKDEMEDKEIMWKEQGEFVLLFGKCLQIAYYTSGHSAGC